MSDDREATAEEWERVRSELVNHTMRIEQVSMTNGIPWVDAGWDSPFHFVTLLEEHMGLSHIQVTLIRMLVESMTAEVTRLWKDVVPRRDRKPPQAGATTAESF